MFARKFFQLAALVSLVGYGALAAPATDRTFTVVVYNVENLFDVDDVSLFEDYQPAAYGPGQLAVKLANVSRVLRQFSAGAGPEIVMFCELEADQTTASGAADFEAAAAGTKVADLLARAPLDPRVAGAPAYAWLLKQLADDGAGPYNVAVGRWRPDPTGQIVAHNNVVLSRFPILEQRTHDTDAARGILEVVVDVDGHRLTLLDNHWKSGASDPATEPMRIVNAGVLRSRLDEILRADPLADVIIGGDFNCQYNQKQRYPEMPRTAMNDVLRSQGDELALVEGRGADLYNLWFELPNERRGSDIWRDEWGTLMQVLLTRGLYDSRGVQYVDNSFTVAAFPGLNADRATGRPVRWQSVGGGSGYSDHFPVAAQFRVVAQSDTVEWLPLSNPSRTAVGPAAGVPVRLPLENAVALDALPKDEEFRTTANLGRFFRVVGRVVNDRPYRVAVRGLSVEINVWIHDPAVRQAFFARHKVGDRVEFVGELGQYRGEWQFVIPAEAAR
jgi:endonuclease/exonuclease/phosphatase family metal-dependent hydrolase